MKEPPARAKGSKRIYRAAAVLLVLTVTALFVWYVVRSLRGHDLSVYATPRAALGIVLAALCWSAGVPLLASAWRGLLASLGVHKSLRELTAILGITQFAKYVPGNIAQYIGRVGMSLKRGIPARPLAASILVETMVLIASAVVVGVGTGALSSVGLDQIQQHGSELAIIVALLLLGAAGLAAFPLIVPKLLRRFTPKYAHALDGDLLPSRSAVAKSFIPCCCAYLVLGAGLVLLALCLLPRTPHDYWLLIAAFSLAWVVGFVTPGAPGGLGVREALMLLMLAPIYTAATASVLIIALRIATTLGDILTLAGGMLILPRRSAVRTTTLK